MEVVGSSTPSFLASLSSSNTLTFPYHLVDPEHIFVVIELIPFLTEQPQYLGSSAIHLDFSFQTLWLD
jgi:hypothetical protein